MHPLLQLAPQGAHRRDGVVEEVGGLEVDVGLVEGERLHQGADRPQELHHRPTGVPVGVEAPGQERCVRAPAPRLSGRHRGVHPEGTGLVGRGGHDAAPADAADDDRLAAQRRLVALLDCGEEGIEIHVQDRRLGAHRSIVPCAGDMAEPRLSRFASTGTGDRPGIPRAEDGGSADLDARRG